jgi:hypothetical protein
MQFGRFPDCTVCGMSCFQRELAATRAQEAEVQTICAGLLDTNEAQADEIRQLRQDLSASIQRVEQTNAALEAYQREAASVSTALLGLHTRLVRVRAFVLVWCCLLILHRSALCGCRVPCLWSSPLLSLLRPLGTLRWLFARLSLCFRTVTTADS